MIVYTEACVCVTLHGCEVEKHTSLPIYEQAEGGVNQAHGPAVGLRRHTTVYTFLWTHTRASKGVLPEWKTPVKLNHGAVGANLKCFASLRSTKRREKVFGRESTQHRKGEPTDHTDMKANFLGLVLCMFCSE